MCIDFHGLSEIIASQTRENLAVRESDMENLSWTQTEKTIPWQSAGLDFAHGAPRNQCSAFVRSPDEEGHVLDNEDESGTRLCEYWGTILQARDEVERHHQFETTIFAKNDYRFDALQFDCFRINIKLYCL